MSAAEILRGAALGLGTGLALIVAIGAQNAFVLRQGLRGEHVALVVAVCALSDVVLIAAGILGIGTLVQAVPAAVDVIRFAGAAFLAGYALMAAKRAVRPGAPAARR
ncbi:LysE/ArgO family amino acid transporter, partial [Arthrobacter sp. GCM10027362]|uniref:LysE/ArgO family amino acid transporter n=1 Tax=Arthrobacter sp. GCM10027362 TaxID=3273379 RepID=UPI00362E787C